MNISLRKPIYELSQKLVAVAQGTQKADFVIKNAKLINVNTAEIQENIDVACIEGRIAYVGNNADHTIDEKTKVLNAGGKYLCPGFLDGHIHVESSMISVTEYAKAVVPHGTTGIYMDPHEIANVLGMEGVKLMTNEGQNLPMKVWSTMPSCVPAVTGFEDNGAEFTAKDIEYGMSLENIAGLGEMMNFPGVIYGAESVHAELTAAHKSGKTLTGHYSHPDRDKGLNAYAASGIQSCHESVCKDDALARTRLGMYAKLREGSAWHDVKETVKAITENKIDSRFLILVSDDCHPDTLLQHGHMDHVIRRAIEEGVNPIQAIQMATINCADCFGHSKDVGSISPSRFADMVLLSDLSKVKVEEVIYNGVHVASKGKLLVEPQKTEYPAWATQSIHLAKKLELTDMQIHTPKNYSAPNIKARVMEIIEANVYTKHLQLNMPIKNNMLEADITQDVAKMFVFDRHKGLGTRGAGLVKGFGITRGAVASTVAHDAHNLMVLGMNDADMLLACQTLADCGGGMVAVLEGKVLAVNPLEIAGLMSNDPVERVAERVHKLDEAWKTLGCHLVSPFMTMALLPLACLPELRLTNRGLVDTLDFNFVELFC